MHLHQKIIAPAVVLALLPFVVEAGCERKDADTVAPGDAATPTDDEADDLPEVDAQEDPLADLDKEPERPTITLEDQLARGEEIYDASCSSCHATSGGGRKGIPAVIGETAMPVKPPRRARLRKEEFQTAAQMLTFVFQSMPKKDPESVGEEDSAAVVAFLLKANGVELPGALSYGNADEIKNPLAE